MMFGANWLQRAIEVLLGYPVDWDASGTWMQLLAALAALYAAWRISRAELDAQRQVAAEERTEFSRMVTGVCEVAAGFIYEASRQLSNRDDVKAMVDGLISRPTAASIINVLKGLDLNRMPNERVAVGVMELRRLCGWTKGNAERATDWFESDSNLPPHFVEAMDTWRSNAQTQMNNIRGGFASAAADDKKMLTGGPRRRPSKRGRSQ